MAKKLLRAGGKNRWKLAFCRANYQFSALNLDFFYGHLALAAAGREGVRSAGRGRD
jgi:hypothetical protein